MVHIIATSVFSNVLRMMYNKKGKQEYFRYKKRLHIRKRPTQKQKTTICPYYLPKYIAPAFQIAGHIVFHPTFRWVHRILEKPAHSSIGNVRIPAREVLSAPDKHDDISGIIRPAHSIFPSASQAIIPTGEYSGKEAFLLGGRDSSAGFRRVISREIPRTPIGRP